ncbi:hypothetical protein [Pseudomonas sp. CCC4.4]|uniref:PKD domain-containing protein n=1 Tax=Pseudomonas sp. CCC4.4 TaxID=3048612 RepID=UPI002B23733C|nr:hypothetical protein [Pseudomonas sp. CCC4.4]MEB0167943.1 hypothetical protein [Pseudomonas sp. CCC4.4]
MDRQIFYPGQVLPETALLQMAKDSMIGLAKLSALVLGTGTVANGFSVNSTNPASLQVVVSPGEIYSLTSVDTVSYSSLGSDVTHSITKQGILLNAMTLTCAAPTVVGQSVNYLIQATYQDVDSNPVLLPYYNSAMPSQPFSGIGNNGLTQNTSRAGAAIVQAKAGAIATTGSQLTPAPDVGYVGLYVVTVAYGQTVIASANISQSSSAPIMSSSLLQSIQAGTANYAADTGAANAYAANYWPAITTPVSGMPLHFLALNASTGPSTFSPNGMVALPLLNQRYSAIAAGQIAIGSLCSVKYVQTLNAWVLVSSLGNAVPSTIAGYGITDSYTKAQVDAITGSQTKVVSNPTVTGSSSVTTGTVVTLTATASSLLNGGTIASFTWTLPDGTTSTTAASSGSATKNVTATGSIGTNYIVKVIATDNAGNTSQQVSKSIAITNHAAPTAPTTLSVASTVYQNSTGNILTVSGSVATDGATITYSLTQSGAAGVTFSQTTGIAAGAQVTFTAPAVAADTPIVISATAVDSMGGVSAATTANVTIAALPTQAGAAYGGGYYVGRMLVNGQNYALIVAPKASGEASGIAIRTTGSGYIPGPQSDWDGLSNTNAMIAAGTGAGSAAVFCKGLNIGGYNDWAIPARDQKELIYRTYKPNTTANSVDGVSGTNGSSNPTGAYYTTSVPAQTSITAYKAGGVEAFTADIYWTSSVGRTNNATDCTQNFSNGIQSEIYNTSTALVRAVRMVKI